MKKKITDDLNQKHIEILFNDFLKKLQSIFISLINIKQ